MGRDSMQTRDQIRVTNILRSALSVEGVYVKPGRRHAQLLGYQHADIGLCALAASTHARKHIVPWLQKVTQQPAHEIYDALRTGASLYGGKDE